MSSDFKYEDGKIYSLVTGDLVAVVDDTGIKMQPGKNALTPKVKSFYASVTSEQKENSTADDIAGVEKAADTAESEEEVNTHLLKDADRENFFWGEDPAVGGTSAPAAEFKTAKALAVWDIPESSLPEFSPALGVATAEFKMFVKKHKFTREQIAELVKRLETKFKKGN